MFKEIQIFILLKLMGYAGFGMGNFKVSLKIQTRVMLSRVGRLTKGDQECPY